MSDAADAMHLPLPLLLLVVVPCSTSLKAAAPHLLRSAAQKAALAAAV
jgi:hypothetical protein